MQSTALASDRNSISPVGFVGAVFPSNFLAKRLRLSLLPVSGTYRSVMSVRSRTSISPPAADNVAIAVRTILDRSWARRMCLAWCVLALLEKPPVIFIPGLMESKLYGSTSWKPHWYCLSLDRELLWLSTIWVLPPEINCMMKWLELGWNGSYPVQGQADVYPAEFGDVDEVADINSALVDTFADLIDYFVAEGWHKGVNLFGMPWDWRYGPIWRPGFFEAIRGFIEDVAITTGEPVVLLGHSMGGFLISELLTKWTTAEWRRIYIRCGVMLAPSVVGGSGTAMWAIWDGVVPELPSVFGMNQFPELVRSLGGVYTHLANFEAYRDVTLAYDGSGNSWKAEDIPEFLRANGKVPGNAYALMEVYRQLWGAAPVRPDVPIAVLYNSGVKTKIGLDLRDGGDGYLYGGGDGTVPSQGLGWLCQNWSIHCDDLATSDESGQHLDLLYREDVGSWAVRWAMATPFPKPIPV